jgi:hypothetical protein
LMMSEESHFGLEEHTDMTIGDSELLDRVDRVDRVQVEEVYADVYVVQTGLSTPEYR